MMVILSLFVKEFILGNVNNVVTSGKIQYLRKNRLFGERFAAVKMGIVLLLISRDDAAGRLVFVSASHFPLSF